jgi:molybdopterin-guanine dinucleotide biosynthesis protein A
VLVLAVDLPEMTSAWLRELVSAGPAIPINGGKLEPLAAVYPKAAADIAERLVRQRHLAMRLFADELFAAGLARPHILSPEELPLFRNLNTPEDGKIHRTSSL